MKRIIRYVFLAAVLVWAFALKCNAADFSLFDREIQQIEDSVSDSAADDLKELGAPDVGDIIANGIDSGSVMDYLSGLIGENSAQPLSALMILTAVLLLVSVAESYTVSLRYTDTKDIMGLVVSLFIAAVVFSPAAQIVSSIVAVIEGASSLIAVYLPVMAGILAFSGRPIVSGAYYAAVMTACKVIASLAGALLEPLLHMILSLSVCAGISTRFRLGGLIETLSKGFKIAVTFSMSIFAAILGLNGALSEAADSVADKAAKFTLSSFVPLIGSSIAEAYGAIRGSVGILRSGIGVFVIMAVFVAFAPVIIQTILWSLTLFAARTAGEALGVNTAIPVLNALSQFIAALRTVLIAVMTVFIIASGIMMKLGGSL